MVISKITENLLKQATQAILTPTKLHHNQLDLFKDLQLETSLTSFHNEDHKKKNAKFYNFYPLLNYYSYKMNTSLRA